VLELFEATREPSDTLPVGALIDSAPAVSVKVAGVARAGRQGGRERYQHSEQEQPGGRRRDEARPCRPRVVLDRDITRLTARAKLERDHVDRRALLEHFVSAAEEERQRIAADIHDDSIQTISAAGLRLQLLRRELDDPAHLELLGDLEQTIQLSISRLRHLLFGLRPPALDQEGLVPALRTYLKQTKDESATRFNLDDRLHSEPREQARLILYRIAQEALTNVRKHSEAKTAEIRLEERHGGFFVRITDDGIGFAGDDSSPTPGHLGLAAMRERAELSGGRLRVESVPQSGTTVEVWIPSLGDGSNGDLPEKAARSEEAGAS
jgi:signal transduction histidine kinase